MFDNLSIILVTSILTTQMIVSLINVISMFENIHKLYTGKQNNKIDTQVILEKLSQFDSLIEEWLVKNQQEQKEQRTKSENE